MTKQQIIDAIKKRALDELTQFSMCSDNERFAQNANNRQMWRREKDRRFDRHDVLVELLNEIGEEF